MSLKNARAMESCIDQKFLGTSKLQRATIIGVEGIVVMQYTNGIPLL
jgi:hypothetical protein